MGEKEKALLAVLIIIIILFFLIKSVFMFGVNYGCTSGNGTLFDNDKSIRCINLNNIDLCKNIETGYIQEKQFIINFTINKS